MKCNYSVQNMFIKKNIVINMENSSESLSSKWVLLTSWEGEIDFLWASHHSNITKYGHFNL